ncbi:MAG: hypothetical protein DI534_03135 [Leifsonia xyli]|nr:MAG: hypothetical protein DI534_03135 [Leifsonia xyli]
MDTTTPTAEQILDAASAIVIDDSVEALGYGTIARRLGTTPREISLVFPVLEQLLAGMLNREVGALSRTIVDNVERDPRGGLPSRIFGYSLCAIYEHPLARALYLADPIGLNRIMRSVDGIVALPEVTIHPELLPALQDVGMMRRDVEPNAVAAVINMIGSGVALSAPQQQLDAATRGLVMMLERAVDADVVDTAPGKLVFARCVDSLAVGSPPR